MLNSWRRLALGECFSTSTGNTPPKKEESYYGNHIPFVKPPDLLDGEIGHVSDGLSKLGESVGRVAPEGAVLVSCIGNLGKAGLATRSVAFNQQINAIMPNPALVLPKFMLLQVLSGTFRQQLEALAAGTTISIVNKTKFNSVEISIPLLEKQRRIVAVLDEAFEGLDRARAHAEANLRDTSELFDSYLSSVFLADAQYWPTVTLPEIAENLDRVRVPITKKDRTSGDVPYYGASGVVDYVADFLFNEDLLLVSEDGANLLARSYPIAFSISEKSWVNNHAHVLRFKNSFTQEYIQLYLNSISLAPYVRGMAQPKLNQASLNRIRIPFPSESGRAEIVGRADSISAETEQLAEAYQASLKGLDELRQSLLQRAFAGELT